MAIVDIDEVKQQINQELDIDDELIERKIDAAQDHLERMLGYKISDRYEPLEVPPALRECVCQIAAHWYENREAVFVGVSGQEMPLGVHDIVSGYRDYFGYAGE